MKKKPFKTESQRILNLMINSIYTHKEIFLRELISNASDAMDKLYYKALTEGGTDINRSDFEIFLEANDAIRTLTIKDNGIGMTRDELENNLGIIAKSGTMDFRQDNEENLFQMRAKGADTEENEEVIAAEDEADAEAAEGAEDAEGVSEGDGEAPESVAGGAEAAEAVEGAEAVAGAEDAESAGSSEAAIDMIGQFGVGFYSAFMVSQKITVISKAYGSDEAWRWQSEGADGYTIESFERDGWGTTIILEMKEDGDEEEYGQYLQQYKIREIVKKYSDYIRYPIRMEVTKSRPKATEETADASGPDSDTMPEYESYQEIDTLNSMVPLWRRNRNEVSDEEYLRFYREKFYDFEKPLIHTHVSVEGTISYNGLLYIPAHAPYNYYSKEYEKGLQLYANGVLIMEKCADLLPDCFSFVKGLVDSPDLSLNISREMLQQDKQVQTIARSLDRRIKTELLKLQKDEREKYEDFFKDFGLQIKFGIYNSYGADREKLQDLLLYYSLKEEKMLTMAEYRAAMPESQDAIYYACGGSTSRIRQLPQTELVLDKGYDILALTDDVDEFAIKILGEYDGKPLKSVSDKDLDLDSDEEKEASKEQAETHKDLFASMKEALGEKVKEVRLSKRLKSHPVCLTSDGPLSLEMEKVLNSMPTEQEVKAERVLEINGSHPVFEALSRLGEDDPEKLKTYTSLLYHQALLIEGLAIEDPVAFANAICDLMV
ncbi:MAG: molecular chaperone HtpG [Clostridiales bacterium]|nr:molecular chaperone HtpG [Clostridiales bacterium]